MNKEVKLNCAESKESPCKAPLLLSVSQLVLSLALVLPDMSPRSEPKLLQLLCSKLVCGCGRGVNTAA